MTSHFNMQEIVEGYCVVCGASEEDCDCDEEIKSHEEHDLDYQADDE